MALKINSALCEVASSVDKDLSLKMRQKEAETKKTTGDKAQRKERIKEAEKKVSDAHKQKTVIEELMKENVNA